MRKAREKRSNFQQSLKNTQDKRLRLLAETNNLQSMITDNNKNFQDIQQLQKTTLDNITDINEQIQKYTQAAGEN